MSAMSPASVRALARSVARARGEFIPRSALLVENDKLTRDVRQLKNQVAIGMQAHLDSAEDLARLEDKLRGLGQWP